MLEFMTTTSFQVRPLPPSTAAQLRRAGGPVYVADAAPGFPCRQCLRDADVGEELILVSHDPFEGLSAYRSASPIFLHRRPCRPFDGGTLPVQLTGRQLSVRAFDRDEMMTDAEVIEGTRLADTLGRFFADDGVDRVHIHNAGRGCFAAAVDRLPPDAVTDGA